MLGKTLYPGSRNPSRRQDSFVAPSTSTNFTCEYQSANPLVCMAAHPDEPLVALVSKQQLELVQLRVALEDSISVAKLNKLSKLKSKSVMPTRARWQSRKSPNPKLAIADSGGVFNVYETQNGALTLVGSSCGAGRAMKSLSFNTEQPNLLITAASDGSARLWDLRTALKLPLQTFTRARDVAREIEFQPESDSKFAVIYDSGVVQRWDLRQRSSADVKLNAHQQGLSLAWHPSLNYLATGGRDNLVQVWNMSLVSEQPEMGVQTPSTVSQLFWQSGVTDSLQTSRVVCVGRPIESNAMRSTYSVYELDKPYVPLYTVESHTDAVTDIVVPSYAHSKQNAPNPSLAPHVPLDHSCSQDR